MWLFLWTSNFTEQRPGWEVAQTSILTFSKKTLHLLTRLVIVDEDVEAQALEALEQLARVSVRAVAYIHPCWNAQMSFYSHIEPNLTRCTMCLKQVCRTCLFIKVFVVDDDALSHSLVAHLILECWWNNSVMAFRRVVLLPRLAILILLTSGVRERQNIQKHLTLTQYHY